jgi:aliphatic nitrilase
MIAPYKVAAAHLAPVFLDREKTVAKACSAIEEASRHGARLIAFPETYIPAFPVWSALRAPIYNHEYFERLAASSLLINGPEIAKLRAAAKRAGIFVSMGFNEGTKTSVGCLWNANVLIGEDGSILNHHRKLVPTFYEKLTWANGDGAGLCVVETSIGRIGMLICGENTNPLARFTLMAQGEQLHIASYPPVWPTRDPKDGSNYDLSQAIRIRTGAHCFEAKCFAVVASSFMDEGMKDQLAGSDRDARRILENTPRGVSMVVGPDGEQIGQSLSAEEGLLYGEIDLGKCVQPKQIHDVVGYYNRFDIFKLTVDRTTNRPVCFLDNPRTTAAASADNGRGEPHEDVDPSLFEMSTQ